jgi:hypothetical protein
MTTPKDDKILELRKRRDSERKNIAKSQLKNGAYYFGHCRNADFARWSKKLNKFIHRDYKYGESFLSDICHPADDKDYDTFKVFEKVESTDVPYFDMFSDEEFEQHVERELKCEKQRRKK